MDFESLTKTVPQGETTLIAGIGIDCRVMFKETKKLLVLIQLCFFAPTMQSQQTKSYASDAFLRRDEMAG